MKQKLKKAICYRIHFIISIVMLSSIILLASCKSREIMIERSGFYFDTIIHITLYNTTDETILDECMERCSDYEALFSTTIQGSDIWNLNHANGKEVTVSPETFDLVSQAHEYYLSTDGVLNYAILPVSSLWDFHEQEHPALPKDEILKEALTHTDGSQIRFTAPDKITLTDPQGAIDLGCFAKGYIADRLKEMLVTEYHVTSGIINLGGNVLTIGTKPDQTPFQIGVRNPFDTKDTAVATINCNDRSVVTSGIYERCFEIDGILYHHILDANTGYPAENSLLSVTISSESSLAGDAFSTLCMLLGEEEGLALINKTEGLEAVFLTKDYEVIYSDGFLSE